VPAQQFLAYASAFIWQGQHSERAEALLSVLHEGYRQGGQVPRCDKESLEVHWFDVYSPKVIAEIGGLGGPLLDRAIVIHMQKAPPGHIRTSTRVRAMGP